MKKPAPSKSELRFTSTLERSTNKLWGAHFLVLDRIAQQLIGGKDRRVVCTLNDTATYQCAMLPHGNGTLVISVNKTLRCKLGLTFGTEVRVRLKKDQSEYGLPLPEELQELFRQDKEGRTLFHALTRGKQRTLLYIVGSAKSTEKRVTRALTIVNHLKVNGGKINHKKLGAALKNPRHM